MTAGRADGRKLKDLDAQLAFTLHQQAIDAVIDVGANTGQYATRLRAAGWAGPILSFEPIPEVHRRWPSTRRPTRTGRWPRRWRWVLPGARSSSRSRPRAT